MKNKLLSISLVSCILATVGTARAATPVITDSNATSLGIIKGADPGDGLDLDGKFIYALSMGADPANEWQIRDALFKGLVIDEVPGASLAAVNRIENWYGVDYGDSPDDDNLELATSSIRWSAAPDDVTLTLSNLKTNTVYKIQLMFGEQCCNRGFDVLVDSKVIVKDFNPGVQQGKIAEGTQEALITHTHTALSKPSVEIKLVGATASTDYDDHNAIFNAITVEEIGTVGDADGDGLADVWEQKYFNNLAQASSGDPDGDGLTNAEEQAAGTDPTKADSDSDGLPDGQEVKTSKTNPLKADTDGDSLADGAEVSTHHTDPLKADTDGDRLNDNAEITAGTDPLKADTDGDGVNDFDELRVLTNPLDKNSVSKTTTVGVITGGDPGEGLDLQGKFIYAFSIGTENPAGQIGDANFTGETVDGATIEQATSLIENWYRATFGDGAADVAIAQAIASIRHGGGGAKITLNNLEVGAAYKLQLMFGEACCARGFDIFVNGRQIADEYAPFIYQGGLNLSSPATNHAAVVTYNFVANSTTAEILTVGATVTTPGYTDRNPIINAVTLEETTPRADTDNDTLPDEWERLNFGDLSQTASADPDSDGLTNAQEFAAGTDPNKADTDGDGLKDGEEVNTTKTDPSRRDTDGDGLSDGDEINTYKTDPTKADTDGDGLPDGDEVLTTGAATKVSNVNIGIFTGGDPGEGLDLQGNFRYAFNVSSAGAAGKAGDADFTADNAPGITVTAPSNIAAWDNPAYGDSPADDVIEKVMQSIRYGPTMRVALTNLIPGSTYKLQLLFYEQCCAGRGFNIYADGQLVAADFSPPAIQGSVNDTSNGAVVSAEIETQRNNLFLTLTVNGRTDPSLTDPNAILDGVTLEVLKEGVVTSPPTITITRATNGQVTITTDGTTLESASTVNGQYNSLSQKTITVDPKTGGQQQFYRGKR